MNNIELFEFDFIDRIDQRKKVDDVFSNKKASNIIWIHGPHGSGKTYFIKQLIKESPKNYVAYVEIHTECQSNNCLRQLIIEIERSTSKPFLSYFTQNYKVISKLIRGVVCSVIDNLTKIDLNSLCDAILDSDGIFTDKYNKQQNNLNLIISYIDSILEYQELLLVIDNFMLCDSRSLDIIMNLLRYYSLSRNKRICFIVSTSCEKRFEHIEYQLQEQVPLEHVEIEPFDSSDYFRDILIRKFNLATTTPHTLAQIYEFCQGYPQNLKFFLHKLFSKDGVIMSDDSILAEWKEEVIEDIIFHDNPGYTVKDLTYIQQVILYIIIEFQKTLTTELVIELVKYISKRAHFMPFTITKEEILCGLLDLRSKGIIDIKSIGDFILVQIERNLQFYSFQKQLKEDPMMPQINGFLFEYTNSNKECFQCLGFSDSDLLELLAWHSYFGKTANWISYNLKYGTLLYNQNDHVNASIIFNRFKGKFDLFSNNEKYMMAKSFFCIGKYVEAESIIESMKNIEDEEKYDYFLLLARIKNLLVKKEEAICIIDNQLLKCENNELRKLTVRNLKLQILSNIADKRNEAKTYFEYTKKLTPGHLHNTDIYGGFLMNSVEFYRGSIADADLIHTKNIASTNNNQYLLATFYTNRGFHEFWQGNIEQAASDFKKSHEMLNVIRTHEISYPLNNLGVCYMMTGEIENAINCFKLGLVWNKSRYIDITLKTSLMCCYAMQKDSKCDSLMQKLLLVLENKQITDISVHLKINYAISYVYKCYGDMENYDVYKEKGFRIARKCEKESLPYIWFENYMDEIETYINEHIDRTTYNCFYQFRFDPWLVTLLHD